MSEPVTLASIGTWISTTYDNAVNAVIHYPLVNILTLVLAIIAVFGAMYLVGLFQRWFDAVTKRRDERIAAREAAKRTRC